MVDQIIDEVAGTFRYQVVHELHFAAGERRAQSVPHLLPAVPAQEEDVLAEQRVRLLVDEGAMIQEVLEVLHHDVLDQFGVAQEHGGRGEVHRPDVPGVWEVVV